MLIWRRLAAEQQKRHHSEGCHPKQKRHQAKALHHWCGAVHGRIFSSVFRCIGNLVLPTQIVPTGALRCHTNLPSKAP